MDNGTKLALNKIYEEWSNELKINCSALLDSCYSNPLYIGIPQEWELAKQRIMIVGEEGYGSWGYGKAYGLKKGESAWTIHDIEKIQNYNLCAIEKYTKGRTAFWRRFKKIKDLGYPCIWNNLDKIHYLQKRKGLKHQLSKAEEQLLHSTKIKILQKEIEILKPTVVVFFGWYYSSLIHELPDICNKLYPQGEGDNSLWKFNVVSLNVDNITYVFTYHPAWHGKQKPVDYEDRVIKEIIKAL